MEKTGEGEWACRQALDWYDEAKGRFGATMEGYIKAIVSKERTPGLSEFERILYYSVSHRPACCMSCKNLRSGKCTVYGITNKKFMKFHTACNAYIEKKEKKPFKVEQVPGQMMLDLTG